MREEISNLKGWTLADIVEDELMGNWTQTFEKDGVKVKVKSYIDISRVKMKVIEETE
jgi:hypothetical protein